MRRTQIYLDEDQDRRLRRRAEATGATKSSLIREAIAAYLDAPADDERHLARFRSAVVEASHLHADLPEGRQYVAAMRGIEQLREAELERRRRD